MTDDDARDEFLDRGVGAVMEVIARAGTPAQAATLATAIRAALAEQIRIARDEEHNPALAEGLARLLGRVVDATETGGTRA